MKIFLKAAAALLAFGAVATTAHAAVVTRSYEVTGLFKAGSLPKITTSFDLTFDSAPTKTGVLPIEIANFQSNGGASFSDPRVSYAYNDYGKGSTNGNIIIGGNGGASSIAGNTNDFRIVLYSRNGGPLALTQLIYATTDSDSLWFASEAVVTDVTDVTPGPGGPTPDPVAAAVPEPATWAMMILGFGVVGGSMRRRTRPTLRTA